MSQITFFRNRAQKNKIDKTEYLDHLIIGNNNILQCEIVFPCSSENPTLRFGSQFFDFASCNYCYCDTFGRYYFIDDVTLLNNGICEIKCSVDVLMSFKNQILGLNLVIDRQEQKSLCNPYIPDPMITGRVDRDILKKSIGNVGGSATGTHIILTTTGGE